MKKTVLPLLLCLFASFTGMAEDKEIARFVNGNLERTSNDGSVSSTRLKGPVRFEMRDDEHGRVAVHSGTKTNQTYMFMKIKGVMPHTSYLISYDQLTRGKICSGIYGQVCGKSLKTKPNSKPDAWERLTVLFDSGEIEGDVEANFGTWRSNAVVEFDNFNLLPAKVVALKPADGAKISMTTPLFKWSEIPDAKYQLLISRNADFSDSGTRTISVLRGTSFQTTIPFSKGKWYWKCGLLKGKTASAFSKTSSFEISADAKETPGLESAPAFFNGNFTKRSSDGKFPGVRIRGNVEIEKKGRNGGMAVVLTGTKTNQTYLFMLIDNVLPDTNYKVTFFQKTLDGVHGSCYGYLFGRTLKLSKNNQPNLWEARSVIVNSGNVHGDAEMTIGTWHCPQVTLLTDFKIEALTPVPLSPTKGARIDTSVPTFRWKAMSDTAFKIQISKSADFADESTLEYIVNDADEFKLSKPLSNGVWYWRLGCSVGQLIDENGSSVYSDPQRFEVACAKDDAPPFVSSMNVAVDEKGDIILKVSVDDLEGSGVDWEETSIKLNGEDVEFERKQDGDRSAFVLKNATPHFGLNQLNLVVSDKNGNRSYKHCFFSNRPPVRKVSVSKDGNILIDGTPEFLVGLYSVQEYKPKDDPNYFKVKYLKKSEPLFKELSEAGFNVVHTYGMAGDATDEAVDYYLDLAAKKNMFVIMQTPGVADNLNSTRNFVAKHASARSILAWTLVDEGDMKGWSPIQAKKAAAAILEIDGNHLIGMALRDMKPYLPVVSLMMPDPYTIKGENPQFELVETMRRYQKIIKEYGRPVALLPIIQGLSYDKLFKTGKYPENPNPPSYEIERCVSYICIAFGSQGVLFYGYNTSSGSMKKTPKHWSELKKIATELRGRAPIFLSETIKLDVKLSNTKILAFAKRFAKKKYLFLINPDAKNADVELTFKKAPEKITHLEKNESLDLKKLKLNLTKFEVVTLEIE